ncbi:MAG TPA: 50S ribosomal protein L31e [Euryarchaeota archaeon]|nr:50S ribosomal protein L31e [archaeon BMS3Bbin15]HDL15646.1 50S ribosomal protein L31e [Euryarchaeota archaeon]
MAEERIYTIPLRDVKENVPSSKRAAKAIRYIKKFVAKHMKNENVKLSESVNEKVWERGIKKIPSKVRVRVKTQEDGSVSVEMAE